MKWNVAAVLVPCAMLSVTALPQQVKSIKGGHGGFQYNATANLRRFFNNNTESLHLGGSHNSTPPINYEIGVCYIEVPTASLARDPAHIPAGNGSSPELSRIRTCCQGYIRNIHNFKICDPICSDDCVNALCTAPEVCTCFPDHVKNLAGFCIPTCPIGCQNGICMDGECVCKNGFQLEHQRKFCVPTCKDGCGGIGNCSAPDTCECREGYASTEQGGCRPKCGQCHNGDCVGPNNCVCHQGYTRNEIGECVPSCPRGCTNGKCVGPNTCECDKGYQTAPDGSCRPTCENCDNGDCVELGKCVCHQGFTRNEFNECVPACPQGCGNGQCIAPNVCSCPHGLDMDAASGQCVAKCSKPCVNGVCTGADVCACNRGYVLDRSDSTGTRCIPHCPGGCDNGVCSAPNFCICNVGYAKDRSVKGRQACVRRLRRSAATLNEDPEDHLNVAELLVFEIPDDY